MRLPSAACSLKIVSRPKLKSLQLLTCSCHKNQNYESTNPFCINLKYCKVSFPSISYYFHIPIIFDFLDIHCPTEVMAVGTIIFPVRVGTIFFPIWTWIHWKLSITSPYQTDLLSSTKIVIAEVGARTHDHQFRKQTLYHWVTDALLFDLEIL